MAFSSESNIQRADPSTIHKKVLTGYQGWFTCHGDGEPISPGHHGWLHWFGHPVPDGGTVNTDLWPDMSAYSPSELYAAPGFRNPDGGQAHLFSSRNPKTVQRHFRWMAENGVDGLFLQRFVGQCDMERDNAGIRRIRDEIGDVVKSSAEKEGRVFAIMYDLAGVDAERTQRIIEHDWNHLLHVKRILDSPNYLRENGRPVIAIWGFGFEWKERAPAVMKAVTDFIRRVTPGGAYIMVGTPSHWRADHLEKHPDLPPAFMRCFDAICPWTIGLFSDAGGSDHYYEHIMQRDIEYIQQWEQDTGKRVDFIPTVHPGGSGYNVSEGNWKRNGAPRHGGKYLWRQFYNTIGRLGVHTVYAAMWDEYNEGTNFLPAIAKASQLPYDESGRFQFIAYDVDGYDLPSDWYMRIAGYAAETLKGEHKMGDAFPERELREWKRTHPRLERQAANASGSAGHSYQQWSAAGETFGNDEEQPPPPYTLEADATCDPVEAREPLASDSTPARSEPPLPSASTRPDPPPAPLNTRPAPPPLPASTRPQAPRVQQNNRPDVYQDTVSSLTDDLRRHSITSSSSQFADSAPGHVPSPVPSLAGSRHSPSPGPPTSHEVPSQWPPPEWNVGITPTHGSSRPHDYNSPAYPTYQSSTSYTPGRTSRPSVSSYPGMRTDSRSPSNMPAGPPSPGFKPPSPALIPPSPYGMPTTPPPHGPSMPEAPKPSMSVPGDSFVGGFHETPAGSGYEPVYAPPPGPPPGTQLDPPFGPPPVHPQAARPGLPPPPPPRPGSEQPPSLSASHYPPPSRTGDSRPGPSGVQGYAQNAMGYAGGAIGRLAGDRRKILEKGVEDLASAGSKLFGRFK